MSEKINLKILVICDDAGYKVHPKEFNARMTHSKWDDILSYWGVDEYTISFDASQDEFQLKGYLRDRNFISGKSKAFKKSRLFFATAFGRKPKEIAKNLDNAKSLIELGACSRSILIVMAAPEEKG